MKKKMALALALVLLVSLTGCGHKEQTQATMQKTTVQEETTQEVVAEESTTEEETIEAMTFDLGEFINAEYSGRPVVEINGDDGTLLSFDLSQTATDEISVKLNSPVEQGYLYVLMSGNVVSHSLESDGSLWDGIARIENGKAVFTVEYEDKNVVTFTISVPN